MTGSTESDSTDGREFWRVIRDTDGGLGWIPVSDQGLSQNVTSEHLRSRDAGCRRAVHGTVPTTTESLTVLIPSALSNESGLCHSRELHVSADYLARIPRFTVCEIG